MKTAMGLALGIAVCAGAGACKKDSGGDPPAKDVGSAGSGSAVAMGSGSETGSGSGSGSGSGGDSDMPAIEETASAKAVATAFGGADKLPTLPQLSKDGATAAIDVSDGPELADFASYEVGFLGAGGKIEKLTVMTEDEAMALEGADDPKGKPDPAKLAANAAAVTKRLADGGYTPFASELQPPDEGKPYDLGGATLEVTEPPPDDSPDLPGSGALTLRLVDGKGKQVKKEVVKAIAPKKDNDLDCGAEPMLGGVWFDPARKRVLIVVGYATGGDMCKAYPAAYRMWAVP